ASVHRDWRIYRTGPPFPHGGSAGRCLQARIRRSEGRSARRGDAREREPPCPSHVQRTHHMSRRAPVKTFFPQTRLAELAARPGGIARSDAIEGAMKSIEGMRSDADKTIGKSLAAIEAVVYPALKGGTLTEIEMYKVLRAADQIVTLAGTFCYAALD